MRATEIRAVLHHQGVPAGEVGRAIQCRGCGEIGRAAWERGPANCFESRPAVTQLSGNFYLHHGHIACGRCQQMYRAD